MFRRVITHDFNDLGGSMNISDFDFEGHRVWVNAPSTLQPYNKFHGAKGIAVRGDIGIVFYFACGDIISMPIRPQFLSEGW